MAVFEDGRNWKLNSSERLGLDYGYIKERINVTGIMTEKQIIEKVQSMCEESLPPYTFKQWESVKRGLLISRDQLKLKI